MQEEKERRRTEVIDSDGSDETTRMANLMSAREGSHMAVQNEDLKENVKKLQKEVNLLKIQLEENSIVMEEKMQKETLALQEKI